MSGQQRGFTMFPSSAGHGSTPNDDGFYLPADSCRLARAWLPWPSSPDLHEPIAALVHAIADFANVSLTCAAQDEPAARAKLGTVADVIVLGHGSARLRDIGPTFLVDGKGGAAAVDWVFNGWGDRALCTDSDRDFAHALLGLAEVRRFRAPLTLEAGSVAADGQGTLIALAPAVFDETRNPQLTRLEAFAIFQQWLGASRVIWIENAHPADRLGSDVRAVAAFIAPGLVAVSKAADDHPLAAVLARARDDLAARDGRGNRLEILDLPVPPVSDLPLSYTSFLVVNGAVFVPGFGVAADEQARAILAEAYPGREAKLIPALALAQAGLSLASLVVPHPARLLERERASLLPRSAWAQPVPDIDGLLQKYIDLAARE